MRSLFVLSICILLAGCESKELIKPVDLTDEFSTVNNIFSRVERDILKIEPKPAPNDEDLKPDPDKNKCACKGTGKIIHGDGHTTPCPFHSIGLSLNK